ncbi:hypothetical protein CAJAP_07540 [Camponotus japonicus]
MTVRHRILWLIHILCYVAIVHSTLLDINDAESCDLLCKQCNVSAIFANDRCECNVFNNNDKEAECIQRIQREIQAIDLNTLSEDLTDEERDIRSLLKSRRRLRMGSCPYPTMPGVETPVVGMVNPIVSYAANGLYDATSPLVGSILHPYRHAHGSPVHHNFHRRNLPGQMLYNLFGHHRLFHPYPVHHGGFRNSNHENPESIGQPTESDDTSTIFKDVPIARNNAAKSVEQNAVTNFLGPAEPAHYPIQTPYIVSANTVYQPMEYQHFNVPYQYTSYPNPLINLLHPNEYIVQPEYIPQYVPGISDPLISASNPNSYCINTNTEQKDQVSTDKIVHSNNEAKQSSNTTKNNISEKENKTEK